MRKRFLALLLAGAVALGLCGCTPVEEDSGKLSVVCSLFPYYDFVRVIGGEWVEPRLLVAAGREAHSFEPTPADVIRVSRADVFVYNGGEGEQWVDEILSSAGESIPTVLRMMDYAPTLEEEPVDGDSHDDHDGHDHDSDDIEYDEHIWTSPKNAILMAEAIGKAIQAADRVSAEYYQTHTEEYTEKLRALDSELTKTVKEAKRDLLIFADRFPFLYLARDYGLEYYAAYPGCSSEAEPSAATVAAIIEEVKQSGVPAIFYIELSNRLMADTIAEATGAEELLLHSCQNVSKEEFERGESYLSLMEQNIKMLKIALN